MLPSRCWIRPRPMRRRTSTWSPTMSWTSSDRRLGEGGPGVR
jgi:hypothetical protein